MSGSANLATEAAQQCKLSPFSVECGSHAASDFGFPRFCILCRSNGESARRLSAIASVLMACRNQSRRDSLLRPPAVGGQPCDSADRRIPCAFYIN
jgi:hypothetical protein